jgi:hypothetical protein
LDGAASIAIPAASQMSAARRHSAERLDAEVAVRPHVGGQEVDVVQALDRAAAARVTAGHVLERGAQARRRLVALAVVVELEDVAVGIAEAKRAAAAEIAVGPALAAAGRLHGADPALERLGAPGPQSEDAHPRRRRLGQLERPALVVAPTAQVRRRAVLRLDLHAHDVDEEAQAPLAGGREQLDRPDVRQLAHPRSTIARRPSSS